MGTVSTSAAEKIALPLVPAGFKVELVAREPLVRNPCAMAFDARGRLFVGQGPQYRNPKPNTPGDTVEILLDSDGDGVFDRAKTFARGLNCVQGLAWRGRDLWIANSPDFTIARDLDGDDEADEYVLVYTDLGNIEHALHGLHFAPDGKLYLSKGNSKSLEKNSDRVAPMAFRELFDLPPRADAPDIPPPRTFTKETYRKTYHDPQDDWGRMGGTLRCDPDGSNLEIVSRGYRNPFDVNFDSAFNWLGTDNDQTEGDRVIAPFFGAHFGWAHNWSASWTGEGHLPTAPMSGPVFTGSGTGVVFLDTPGWPAEFRGVWLINDFLQRTSYVYRPRWEGALLQPEDGKWQPFARAGESLFQPIDARSGPDGALYITGWGTSLAAVLKDGQLANEGRVFRIAPSSLRAVKRNTPHRAKPAADWATADLIADLGAVVAAWRSDAADELVRRGAAVKGELMAVLGRGLPTAQETWTLWTLGRLEPHNRAVDDWFARTAHKISANARLQSLRIVAHRIREWQREHPLPGFVSDALGDADARFRFAAVQAIQQARAHSAVDALWELAARETDRITFYAAWRALQEVAPVEALRGKLLDARGGVRRAALLALLEAGSLGASEVEPFVKDPDAGAAGVAALWLAKRGGNPLLVIEPPPGDFSGEMRVAITPGLKPSSVSYTIDGTEPTADSRRSTARFMIKETTTVKAALFVDGRKVGNTAEVTYRQRGPKSEQPALVLAAPTQPATTNEVVALLPKADPRRGQRVFSAAGCFACHQVDQEGGSFGPDLSAMAARGNPEHIIRSILEPNAAITEGYALLNVTRRNGKAVGGRLHEETGEILTLMLPDGSRSRIRRGDIAKRESLHLSPMPPFDRVLTARDTADLVAWLAKTPTVAAAPGTPTASTPRKSAAKANAATTLPPKRASPDKSALGFELKDDRLVITDHGTPVTDYVFKDAETFRPHWQNLHAPGGARITRTHPPAPGDPSDHATMHPGAWFAFGSINGEDFWRNKARIEHEAFIEPPKLDAAGTLTFATSNRLLTAAGEALATQTLRVSLARRGDGYLFTCETTLKSDSRELVFGDQEEMGFGVRVATPLMEKNGGRVLNSRGDAGAKAAWGKVAEWCSYVRNVEGRTLGVAVFSSPKNPHRPWWHTRDYGLIVANAFGKRALPAAADGALKLARGESLTLRYGLLVFDSTTAPDFAAAHQAFIAAP